MINSGKDTVTAHLEKNIISNIIQTARASLKEPSRPFTPSQPPRALFSTSDSNRPPSAYSMRSLSKDLEPLKQRSVVLDGQIQTNRKVLSEESKSAPRKPIKVPQEPFESKISETHEENEELLELRNILCILEKIKLHSEVRNLYDDKDLDEFLDYFTVHMEAGKYIENKPQWACSDEVLKALALALISFENDTCKVMKIAKCLLENVTSQEILYKKKKKIVTIHPLASGAVKVLYQFSKNEENDSLFLQEKVSDTMYMLLINIVSEDTYLEIDLPYEFLIFLLGTLKNISVFECFVDNCMKLVSPLTSLLPTPLLDCRPHRNPKHPNLLIQVTGILKNLSSKASLPEFLSNQIIEKLALVVQLYKDQELVLNCLKTISKVGLEESVCQLLQKSMGVFFTTLQEFENLQIITRSCYILANILTVFESSRCLAEKGSVQLLVTISSKYLGSKDPIHIDLLIKSVRLLANLISAPHIGESLGCANQAVKLLAEVLSNYNIDEHEELILNAVACITNILYFDIPGKDYIAQQVRILIFSKLPPLLVSNFNEEVTIETLRALGNLTRHESVCRELPSLYMIDILMMLLDHSNWSVVYYNLGCLINVSSLAKELFYSEKHFDSMIRMIEETNLYEPDLSIQIFMILCNLCSLSKGMVPWESVAGDENVKKLSALVKDILQKAKQTGDPAFIKLLAIGENLNELMPKPLIPCTFKDCGRKFANPELLQDHWNRRHS